MLASLDIGDRKAGACLGFFLEARTKKQHASVFSRNSIGPAIDWIC